MKIHFSHQLKIKYSRVIEGLSLLCVLGNPTLHNEVLDLSRFIKLQEMHKIFFEKINKYPHLHFAWLEFALLSNERESLEVFTKEVEKHSLEKQLVYFMASEIDLQDASKMLLSETGAKEVIQSLKLDARFQEVVFSFKSLMAEFKTILLEIDQEDAFNTIIDDLLENRAYEETLKIFAEGTLQRHPLSFTQELMGKPFWNIADYAVYELIPVYFLSPFMLRLMDHKTMIFIQSLQKSNLSSQNQLENILDPLKSISDATRLKILRMLYMQPMYGKEIAQALDLTTPTVSHHLDALHQQGFVNVEKVKQIKYFSTNYTRLSRKLDEVNKYIKTR